MNDATLVMIGARPAVRLERLLPDPPSAVWGFITDREQLKRWFPCDVIVDDGRWAIGATISFLFPPEVIDLTLTGTVLELDEPNALAFSWGEDVLRFGLAPRDGGTLLLLLNELDTASAARNAAGWDGCLDRLTGHDVETGAWQERFERYTAIFEPELGPQQGPPDGYRGERSGG